MLNYKHKIISISGNARSGKDTLGNNFIDILRDSGIKAVKVSFADELKKSVDQFLIEKTGISAFTEDDDEKKIIRPFLVCWGTDVIRKIDNNTWINKLEENLDLDAVNIITDLRFSNELDWVKRNDGLSVLIEREGIEPANKYEEDNNSILKNEVDVNFTFGNFEDKRLLSLTSNEILNKLLNKETYELWKVTCPL
jgi:hypothetical protein